MTTPALPLTAHLTNACTKSTKNRLIQNQYGNGYKQIVKDGLNNVIETWQLKYHPLTGSELTTVRDFITTVNCDTWFTWTPFGESTSKKWSIVPDSVKEDMFNYSLIEISFTIEQRFDLGT